MTKKNAAFILAAGVLTLSACAGGSSSSLPSSLPEETASSEEPASSLVEESSSSSSSSSIEEKPAPSVARLVVALKEGIGLKGEYDWLIMDRDFKVTDTYRFTNNVYIDADEYYQHQYQNAEDGMVITNSLIHFYRTEEGIVATKSLDYTNTVVTEDVVDLLYGPEVYDDDFWNPFADTTEEDWIYKGDNVYALDVDRALSNAEIPLMFFYYVNNGTPRDNWEVRSLEITVDDEGNPLKLDLATNAMFAMQLPPIYVQVLYEAEFAARDEFEDMDVVPETLDENAAALATAVDSFKAGNFTLEVTDNNYVNGAITPNTTSFEILATEEGVVDAANDAAYLKMDDGVEPCAIEDGKLVGLHSPVSSIDLSYYLSDFLYSPAFFESEDGKTFTAKDNAPAALSHLLPDAVFGGRAEEALVDTLKITINDDGTVTYTYDYQHTGWPASTGDIAVTVKNIGTTTLPYDLDADFEAYVPFKSWTELLEAKSALSSDTDYVEKYTSVLGKSLDEILPYYEPEVGWDYEDRFGTQSTRVRLGSADSLVAGDTDRYVAAFVAIAEEAGFTYNEEKTTDYETYYTNAEAGFDLSFNVYDDYFYAWVAPIAA